MALDAMWAVLTREVLRVSEVQAPIPGGLGDTPDTLPENARYQAQPAWALGCTLATFDAPKKNNTDNQTTEAAATPTQTAPKRLFRQCGPWLNSAEQSAAQAYHAHHFNCHQCTAAGRDTRYGRRCAVGLALWTDYTGADDLQTQGA
jgi:hypothetical protein